MNDLLLPFCKWLQNQPFALAVSGSLWAYPYVQLIHYAGLSIWVGTTLLVDLRLMGLVRRRENAAQFAKNLNALSWIGFTIAVIGGFLLFSGSAETYFLNAAFRIKFPLFLFGIAYHGFLQWKESDWGQSDPLPGAAKLAALGEILIWLAVVTAATRIPNN